MNIVVSLKCRWFKNHGFKYVEPSSLFFIYF